MKLLSFVVFAILSAALLPSYAFAEGSPMSGFGGLMPLLFIFVFFYLFCRKSRRPAAPFPGAGAGAHRAGGKPRPPDFYMLISFKRV